MTSRVPNLDTCFVQNTFDIDDDFENHAGPQSFMILRA